MTAEDIGEAFRRGSSDEKAGWEKPWIFSDVLGKVSTTSSFSLWKLLSSYEVLFSDLTVAYFASTTVKQSKEHIKKSVSSNQWITQEQTVFK